ncbi:MAG: 2-polyprenyl-3-methyl-6-methoxy-1,4-benzoquinone monooxygenase [Usitatibacter sp.]
MTSTRHSPLDLLLIAADEALRTLSGAVTPARASPARPHPEGGERALAVGLMRVNHTGEICAQALYSGQAMFARQPKVRSALLEAAAEERDHLSWCRGRLDQLGARTSVLDPLWYAGSFGLGLLSGIAGDRWSMGFLTETEAQVERHLEGHLERLPADDARSRAIIEQMREDENRHGSLGRSLGAAQLPPPVKAAMRIASKVMTGTAFYV